MQYNKATVHLQQLEVVFSFLPLSKLDSNVGLLQTILSLMVSHRELVAVTDGTLPCYFLIMQKGVSHGSCFYEITA